jgi:Domain of unknown function (DUF3067)
MCSMNRTAILLTLAAATTAFVPGKEPLCRYREDAHMRASFLENAFGFINSTKPPNENFENPRKPVSEDDISLDAFQAEINKREDIPQPMTSDDFDGYALRDVIVEKWDGCYDLEFQPVDSFGFREIYLNVMPFKMGTRGRWRHSTELDYLMHLQAVVEILVKYKQLDYVLYQIKETNKKPRAGTSPLVAVPLRLDLTPEQVKRILRG